MTDYELYVFLLCLIVFVMLAGLSALCIYIITKLSLRLIHSGVEDENILQEHEKNKKKTAKCKYIKIADYAVSGIVCLVFVVMLFGAVVSGVTYNILSRRHSGEFSALERTTVMMAVAAVIFTLKV